MKPVGILVSGLRATTIAAWHCRELTVTTATTDTRLYTHRRVSEKEAEHDYLKKSVDRTRDGWYFGFWAIGYHSGIAACFRSPPPQLLELLLATPV